MLRSQRNLNSPVKAELSEGLSAMSEPTGFVNRSDSSISFDDGTLTFTIQPLAPATYWDVYVDSVLYRKAAAEAVVITDTDGLWFFYYDADGVLTASQTPWTIGTVAPIAYLYWNAAGNVSYWLADERHGIVMDCATHKYLHHGLGAVWEEGLALGDFTLGNGGALDTDAQVSVSNGEFHDEDIEVEIAHSAAPAADYEQILQAPAQIPVIYQDGTTGTWRERAATTYPFWDDNPNRPKFNEYSAPNWVQSEVTNNYFFNVFLVATNAVENPVKAILGQAEHSSLGDAEDESYDGLDLTGLPFQEVVALYRLTYQTKASYGNTPAADLIQALDLRSTRKVGAGAIPQAHNALSARDDYPAHPITALQLPAAVVKDADYSAVDADSVIDIDAGANTVEITLPDATTYTKGVFVVGCIDASFAATLKPVGTQTINGVTGAAAYTLVQWETVFLYPEGGNWRIR